MKEKTITIVTSTAQECHNHTFSAFGQLQKQGICTRCGHLYTFTEFENKIATLTNSTE